MEVNWNKPDVIPPDDGEGELFSIEVLIFDIEQKSYTFGWYDYELERWSFFNDTHEDDDHENFVWMNLPPVEGVDMKKTSVQDVSGNSVREQKNPEQIVDYPEPVLIVLPKECPSCGSGNLFNLDQYYECDDCGFKFK